MYRLPMYRSKTIPLEKQRQAIKAAGPHEAFGWFMEMGTGKSKVTIDSCGKHFDRGDAKDVIIVCPNGLQRNWVEEFEKHCGAPYKMAFFEGNMKAEQRRELEQLLRYNDPGVMRVLAISYEALRGNKGFDCAWDFMEGGRKFFVALDESQRIKSTKRTAVQRDSVLAVGRRAEIRRILSGTSSPNSPLDLFSQFKFLDPAILGYASITAFRAHYCVLMDPNSPQMRGLANKIFGNPQRAKYMQIQQRDADGQPVYKNLEELSKRIAPFVFRARKDECLDLPPKVYAPRITFDLSPKQRKIYDVIKRSIIAEFVHAGKLRRVDSALQLTRLGRLAAVCGNYFPDEDRKKPPIQIEPSKSNPRLLSVANWLEDGGDVSSIIWARHTAEIDELCEFYKGQCVRLDGSIKPEQRQINLKRFQAQEHGARKLVAQLSVGIGFDAYAASLVAYYTNSFNLEHRLQSEDRAHRKGLTHSVTYGDFEALDTQDAKVILALRAKREISEVIAGDPITNWI